MQKLEALLLEASNDGIIEHFNEVRDILKGSDPSEAYLGEVFTDENYAVLTHEKIAHLAACISADAMEILAEGYMNIDYETISDLKDKNDNATTFNIELIENWAEQNPGFHKSKVLIYTASLIINLNTVVYSINHDS